MNYYIGADLGTSALKLLLIDEKYTVINSVTKKYPLYFPKSGWSEQSPDDWWNSVVSGIRELVQGIDAMQVKAIGVGGQMHGLVMLDEHGKVLRNAILWNDGRTQKQTDYLNETVGQEFLLNKTANIAFAGFTAPKILWVKENEPELFARANKFMLPKDYINYKLTGAFATDFSDASGTLLLDVKNKCWSEDMLKICSVTKDQLPKLFESYDIIGTLSPDVAKEIGLCSDVKVVAGAGDNAASAIGAGVTTEGKCNISLGTSGTVFIPSDNFTEMDNGAIHNFCHANGKHHLMACILSAASSNSWFCEKILKSSDFAGEQAEITDDMLGENNVFFLPYLMGERSPINDTDASAVFIGMRADTQRCDMLLAVLEGVAFAIRDCIEQVDSSKLKIKESLLVGGGAKSPLWAKIISNVLNIPLSIPSNVEGPAMGGALLAACACGECKLDGITSDCKKRTSPEPTLVKKYENKFQKYKKLYPTLKSLYGELK